MWNSQPLKQCFHINHWQEQQKWKCLTSLKSGQTNSVDQNQNQAQEPHHQVALMLHFEAIQTITIWRHHEQIWSWPDLHHTWWWKLQSAQTHCKAHYHQQPVHQCGDCGNHHWWWTWWVCFSTWQIFTSTNHQSVTMHHIIQIHGSASLKTVKNCSMADILEWRKRLMKMALVKNSTPVDQVVDGIRYTWCVDLEDYTRVEV